MTESSSTPEGSRAQFALRTECISCGGAELQELSAGRFDEGLVQQFIAEDPWGEHPAPFLKGCTWSFVKCSHCGMAFHRRILTPEWAERRFSRWMSQEAIKAFESRVRTPESDLARAAGMTARILQLVRLTRADRGDRRVKLLDFGCGYGEFLSLSSLSGFEAVGVDRSAAKRENAWSGGIHPDLSDVLGLGPFDVITLFEVLEHLDHPRDVLMQLSELLRPGGILLLTTPNCDQVTDIRNRDDYLKIHPLEHINAFTPASMRDFVGRLNFKEVTEPFVVIADSPLRTLKQAAKGLLGSMRRPGTQVLFRKQ